MGRRSELLSDALVAVTLVLSVVLPVWPGVFTIDSQAILASATDGAISNWYSPIHALLWRVLEWLHLPIGTALVLSATAFVTGVLALLQLLTTRKLARWGTVLVVLWPPVYGSLGWVGRDVWFTAEFLWMVVMLGRGVANPARRHRSFTLAALLSVASMDARQNGVYSVAIAAFVIFFVMWPAGTLPRRAIRGVAVAGLFTLVAGFLVGVVQRPVVQRITQPEYPLYVYDLFGMSLNVGEVLAPESVLPSQDLADIGLVWSLDTVDLGATSVDAEGLDSGVSIVTFDMNGDNPESTADAAAAWRDAIVEHPMAYAKTRSRLLLAQLGVSQPARAVFFRGSDDLGIPLYDRVKQSFPKQNEWRIRYVQTVTTDAGESRLPAAPIGYVVLGGGVGVVMLRRGGSWRLFGTLTLASISFAVTLLFFVAPVTSYRYMFPTIVLTTVMFVGLVVEQLRSRSDRPGEEAAENIRGVDDELVERRLDDLQSASEALRDGPRPG